MSAFIIHALQRNALKTDYMGIVKGGLLNSIVWNPYPYFTLIPSWEPVPRNPVFSLLRSRLVLFVSDAKSSRYGRYICAILSNAVLILLYYAWIGTGTVSTALWS